jgi:glycosyltransferase involved in cell wall biosynthesis
MSYLSEPFFKKDNKLYLNKHQNRKEAVLIGKFFLKKGLGIKVERFDKILFFKQHRYRVIFGLEPNFHKMAKVNPNAVKIYYATGAYYEHQNAMIIQRTNEVNKKHNLNLSYQRLIIPHNSCMEADYIFQIGTSETIRTYPESLSDKIFLIRQTCHDYVYDIKSKLSNYDRNSFMWMGGKGSILKGLDLVLDFFAVNTEYTLHVVGYVDDDFYKAFHKQLNLLPNIRYHGFLPIADAGLISIAEKCSAIIFPSGSEGCPGSVVNMNKLGLIPIVSKWCAYDEITELGYVLPALDTESISDAVKWIAGISQTEIEELFMKNFQYANSNFNESAFEHDFMTALNKILP